MKKITILLVGLVSVLFSCEEVIDVELQDGPVRLVIEASLDWEKGTVGNDQIIKLRTSTPYFDTQTDTSVTGASVEVINLDTNEVFVFQDQNNGNYITDAFVPILNNTYQLTVIYNGEVYQGTETLLLAPDINTINQSIEDGFDDENLEVNVYFDDPEDEENYYLLKYYEEGDLLPSLEDVSDEFVNGNEIHDFYEKEDDEDSGEEAFVPGDVVEITLYAISERYYNYIKILNEQTDSGDPFSTTPVQIRGNCVNQTNQNNYAFGYFRVTQYVKEVYTFE
ncbi:MAG TPA: DUF4249 domain-containing protein [Mangrovimonas sp.]|nr:DUF4249 domain-containing protein [Mangrovimonas sp.]